MLEGANKQCQLDDRDIGHSKRVLILFLRDAIKKQIIFMLC